MWQCRRWLTGPRALQDCTCSKCARQLAGASAHLVANINLIRGSLRRFNNEWHGPPELGPFGSAATSWLGGRRVSIAANAEQASEQCQLTPRVRTALLQEYLRCHDTQLLTGPTRRPRGAYVQHTSFAVMPMPPSVVCRCRAPSLGTVAAAAASASVQPQTAPRWSHHAGPQQQQQQQHQQQQQARRTAKHRPGFTGLASYRFRTADVDCRWLEAVVREAVVHLAQAPFLQVPLHVCASSLLLHCWVVLPLSRQFASRATVIMQVHTTCTYSSSVAHAA